MKGDRDKSPRPRPGLIIGSETCNTLWRWQSTYVHGDIYDTYKGMY